MADEAHIVDARAIDDAEIAGTMLVAQCDNPFVLSDVKLALLEHLPPDTPVVVLQRLGLADEHVATVGLATLDHDVVPDHLTSLYVQAGGASAAHEMVRLFLLAKRLRDPGGCPWDAEQTHHSLTRYLLEESYEVVEAVEAIPMAAPGGDEPGSADAYAALADELGDLLYQVVFHAVLAQEADAFTMADVARGVHDKLVRRHPHVFGDVVAADTGSVMRNWEQIKREEKGTTSLVDGITARAPIAPLHQQAVPQGRVDRVGAGRTGRGARPRRRRGGAHAGVGRHARSRPRATARGRGRGRTGRRRGRRVGVARLGRSLPQPVRGDGAAGGGARRRPRQR